MGHLHLFTSDPGHIKMGNGKTLTMTMFAYDKKTFENYTILTNYDVKFSDRKIDTDDLDSILKQQYKSIIMIDELPAFFNAYAGVDETENEVRNVINQARKREIYIWGTAQVFAEVPRHIRRKVTAVYLLTKIHRNKDSWGYCEEPINDKCSSDDHRYKIDRMNGMTKIVSPDLVTDDDKVIHGYFYDQYDTNEILMSSR